MRKKRSSAEVTIEREANDYRKAFRCGPDFDYCPVRIHKNRLNKHGNVCGLGGRTRVAPERIESEHGTVLAWRCDRGHIFHAAPPSAPLNEVDVLELTVFRQFIKLSKDVGPKAAEALCYRGAEMLDLGTQTTPGAN